MSSSLDTVRRFCVQVIVGAVLFAVVMGAAVLIFFGVEWAEGLGIPVTVLFVAKGLEQILIYMDAFCFVVFMAAEVYIFIREVWRGLK